MHLYLTAPMMTGAARDVTAAPAMQRRAPAACGCSNLTTAAAGYPARGRLATARTKIRSRAGRLFVYQTVLAITLAVTARINQRKDTKTSDNYCIKVCLY